MLVCYLGHSTLEPEAPKSQNSALWFVSSATTNKRCNVNVSSKKGLVCLSDRSKPPGPEAENLSERVDLSRRNLAAGGLIWLLVAAAVRTFLADVSCSLAAGGR